MTALHAPTLERGRAQGAPPAAQAADTLPLLFIMEKVLGHATQCDNLHAAVEQIQAEEGVASRFVEVSFWKNGGWLERPWVPYPLKGALRGVLQVREGRRGFRPAAQLMNTNIAAFFPRSVRAVPTVLTTDITPAQYDRMAACYQHRPDRPGLKSRLKHAYVGGLYRSAAALAVWSEWTKASFVEEYGVEESRVHVIPPGVDLSRIPCPERLGRRGLPKILFVGGHFQRKGGDLLLEGFRRCLRNKAELHLVTRDAVSPEQGVHVYRGLGPNDPKLLALLAEADIFCLPTRGDCYSVAGMEAMAAGLPVITTSMAGIPDIVQDGVTGCLLEPGDADGLAEALNWLVEDAGLRRAMGRAGRKRAEERFDHVKNARRHLEVLRSVAERG